MPDTSGREKSAASGPPVGRVVGTEDSTPLQFSVALDQDAYLQLDDVVVTVRARPRPGAGGHRGVVTEVRARHEGATYGSDVFLIAEGVLPAQVQETAEVTTTRVDPEVYVPPWPGAFVLPGHRRGARQARCTSTRWSARSRPGSAATATPIYLNRSSSTAPAARTCPSPASPAWPPRPASRTFLLYSIFRSACWAARGEREGAGLQRQGRGPAVPRPPQPPAGRTTCGPPTRRWGSRPRRSPTCRVYAPPTPGDLTGRPTSSAARAG